MPTKIIHFLSILVFILGVVTPTKLVSSADCKKTYDSCINLCGTIDANNDCTNNCKKELEKCNCAEKCKSLPPDRYIECANKCQEEKNTSTPSNSGNNSGSGSGFNYTPMEKIPGFEGSSGSFPEYVLSIYRFGIWTIGIAAMMMIMVGGYMYITSAGNTSSTGKAKGIITDAIIGLLLALTAYLILYTINPELVKIKTLQMNTGAAGVPGEKGGPGGTTSGPAAACPPPPTNKPIDFSKATEDSNIKPNAACNNFNFSNSEGVDPAMLKAIAQMESSCGANKGPSKSGACGLMQILPTTASKLAKRNVSCEELKSNDNLSIELAAKYVKEGQGSSCVKGDADVFAGYNSGYGCGKLACTGEKNALCESSDCPGGKAYQCCINPGGLKESISYAWNGTGLYNKFK